MLAGLREELNSAMRSQWGTGQKLRNMVDDVIGKNTAAIEKQIKVAVLEAIQSDEFVQMAREVMTYLKASGFSESYGSPLLSACGYIRKPTCLMVFESCSFTSWPKL